MRPPRTQFAPFSFLLSRVAVRYAASGGASSSEDACGIPTSPGSASMQAAGLGISSTPDSRQRMC